jgi:uncharacterized membrane protein YtjA (UPF0391 family)
LHAPRRAVGPLKRVRASHSQRDRFESSGAQAEPTQGMRPALPMNTLPASGKNTLPVSQERNATMLYWAAVFFVISIIAAIFGFGGIAASAVGIAKLLFVVFLVLAGISLLMGRRHVVS